eukprot:s149_g28.t1
MAGTESFGVRDRVELTGLSKCPPFCFLQVEGWCSSMDTHLQKGQDSVKGKLFGPCGCQHFAHLARELVESPRRAEHNVVPGGPPMYQSLPEGIGMERQMSRVGCSMANKPWPDEMEMFEPYVTGIMWFKKLPDTKAVADAFEKHLWPCHRFNSCIEGSKWVRRHETMDREYHFVEMDMPDEKAIEEFAMKTQLTSLPRDHPQWKVFLLRAPGSNQPAVLMHLHHALGDGLGLLFATSPLMGVQVCRDHPLVKGAFLGLSLPGRRCAHDITDDYLLKVSTDQWACAVSQSASVICLQAFVFPDCLDVSLEGGGVMPTPECRIPHPHGLKHVVELFSGGFSGWSQVVRLLGELDFPLVTALAIDSSESCVEAYRLTFGATRIGPDLKVQLDVDDHLPLKKVIEADILELSWVHLLGTVEYEFGVCSPPCPPWSNASVSPPGLRRRDGALSPLAIALLALIGCKVVCLENVSGMTQHDHWGVIKRWIAYWNLDLRWAKVLDLAEIAPQKRERLILVATQSNDASIRPHICVTWPKVHPLSMQQFDVLTSVEGHWLDECIVSADILDRYLDPANLPKPSGSSRAQKRTKVDVARYRLRTPEEQMSCVMANYGAGHELPEHAVTSGGLYGALLALPSGLRFASTPEIALLQLAIPPLWIPSSRRVAVSILGNAISTAHAGIALLNALAFTFDITHIDIADLFTKVIEARLKASMLTIQPGSGGYWLLKSDVDPTLPIRECEQLVLRSPVDDVVLHVQAGLMISSVLEALLGQSKPSEIFLAPAGNVKHKVLIKPNTTMPRDRTILFASVQVAMIIPVKSFGIFSQQTDFVLALCPFGLVVVARSLGMTVADVNSFLRGEFSFDPLFATDMLGFEIDRDALCPDAVVFMTTKGVQPVNISSLLALDFHVERTVIGLDGMSGDIADTIELLRASGISDLLLALGWTFSVPIAFFQDGTPQTLQLYKCPQRLAIEGDDAKHCLAVILFITQWRTQAAFGVNPTVLIKFKFWNSWVWEGTWDVQSDFSCVKTIWSEVMSKFHLTWDIRFIINGYNANFQRPLREFLRSDQTVGEVIKVYLVVSLHGGGRRRRSPDPMPKSSVLRRRLPTPPPIPNTTEQPPTPPSVPGTPPQPPTPPSVPGSPAHPPTPPPPSRLVKTGSPSEESSSSSSEVRSNDARPEPNDPLSFQDVFRLDVEDREQALMVALQTWMSLTRIDWDVDMFAISELRLTVERNLMFWDGPFPKLMKFVQFLQQTRLELVLEKMGWIVTVKFLEFSNPVKGRLLFISHPGSQAISQKTCYMFMQAALVILALPRGVLEGEDTVYTKIKVWGHPAFKGWLPGSMHVAFLLDPWELVGRMLGEPLPMRAVAAACTMNPDFQLGQYAKKDPTGKPMLTVHYVLGLRGGGPPPPFSAEDLVKQKNALATILLSQGADVQETAHFVDKILKASSPATIEALLKPKQPKEKFEGIVKFAKALNLTIPAIENQQKKHREKIRERVQKPANEIVSSLNLETIRIQEGFFKNEDATPCPQRFDVVPKQSGVCLMTPAQAIPWLSQTSEVSQDELAIVVLGRCECSEHSKGRKVQIPAYCGNHEPLVLAGCLHDLGKKKVQTNRVNSNISTTESTVVSFTVCRDELPDEKWSDIAKTPVKATLELCCPDLVLLAPPWGRVFQREKVKVPPNDATSLQFHARISKSDLTRVLQASGSKAVYTAAKREDRQISDDFQVVWMPHLSLVDLQVSAATYPQHQGIVRSMKGGPMKVSRGLRFRREDFRQAFAEMRPNDDVPSDVPSTFMFKLSPVPLGAKHEHVQSWLESLKWKARPIRLLASTVWLCAAASKYESQFEMWDDQPILARWMQSKPSKNQVVIAGNARKIAPPNGPSNHAGSNMMFEDPWAYYRPLAARNSTGQSVPAAVTRKLQAPIEDRLTQQNTEWENFKEQQKVALQEIRDQSSKEVVQLQQDVLQLKETVSTQCKTFEKQNALNAKEFSAIRSETKDQFAQLTASLQDSHTRTSWWHVPFVLERVFAWSVFQFLCSCHELCLINEDLANLRSTCLWPVELHKLDFKPWPCVNCLEVFQPEVSLKLPFNFFARFFGIVVGQASHPGPGVTAADKSIRLAISNPTAVFKKTDEIVRLGADVVLLSETSATSVIQQEVSSTLFRKGFVSFWSKPAPPKKATLDSRPSYRGEALGTSIFSSLPARKARIPIPDFLWDSCRICCSIIRLFDMEVLLVSVYGFATRHQHGVRMNDMFLASVFDVVQQVNMPFIVAGDFNDPPHQLPAFSMFRELGAIEAFSWYKSSRGVDLPATCLGSTRNDTAIFHPQLVPLISHMTVDSKLQFDAHVPLIVTFKIDKEVSPARLWNIPCSWAAIAPPTELIDTCYTTKSFDHVFDVQTINSAEQVGQALLAWSHAVEVAIDKALSLAHRLNPVVYPWPSLHPKFRGRCKVKTAGDRPMNGGVRDDPTGAFTPDVETFSLKSKQVVRQVRRLKSFRRALKAFSDTGDPNLVQSRRFQLQHEWNVIREAKGFGSRWSSWILAYELVPFVPLNVPDMQLLDVCVDITEMYCHLTCQQEARNRYHSFRQRIRVDHDDGFLSLSYKIVRGQTSPPLTEVPFETSATATLLRSRKGSMSLRLSQDMKFQVGSLAHFGDAQIKIHRQVGRTVFFSSTAHNIPAQANLVQKSVAMTTEEIQDAFNSFWTKFWLRDSVDETTSMQHWSSFVQEVVDSGLSQRPPIDVSLDSLPIWMETIKSLKARKAHGIDGWRYEELKKLPASCIRDLAKIMSVGAQYGLPACLMAAKTTLLAKVPGPESLHQIRPITVLGVLYRVTGKVLFSQIAKSWQSTLPMLVSGGIPGRGVKDLAFLLKHKIERALSNKSQLGGFSLDLRKAFNTFPRLPICFLWQKLGVPQWVCHFWLSSLMRMERFPHLHNRLGSPLNSTTGAPEGDCLSVLAMLALATAFHAQTANEEVSPHGYADNWGWMTFHIPSHKKAFAHTLRFAASLKLEIDFQKSWHWGITREFREACESLALLFPSGDVPVKIESHVRDLGERFHYNGNIHLANVKDKILEAERRIKRVKNLPLDVSSKAALIQASVWPMALYSADTAYLGLQHFQTLRSAALFAFVGKCNFASPWLACFSLSTRLLDPLLYVVLVALRATRRLATICFETAISIVRLAASFSGVRPFGPATTLRKYLDTLGWSIDSEGTLTGPEHMTVNLLTDSTDVICRAFIAAWPHFLVQNLSRKGTGDYIPHPSITAKCMVKFPPRDQGILVRNLVGGFQTGMTQKQWDTDATEKCPLCGEDDARPHRLLNCQALSDVRNQCEEAVEISQDIRPEWVYVPLARSSPDLPLQRAFVKTIPPCLELSHFEASSSVVFYTDGGAIHPHDPDARLASWAVVSDVSGASVPQIQMMQSYQLRSLTCPLFRVVATGLVVGRQSAARGELTAYLKALCAAERYDHDVEVSIVTDASYVCFVDFAIRSQIPGFPNHRTRNADLIRQIQNHWSSRVKVYKTKSHRNFEDAQDWTDLWTIYGNHAADLAASMSLRQVPDEIRQLFKSIENFHKTEAEMMHKVMSYLVKLNRTRDELLKKTVIVGQPENAPVSQSSSHFMPPQAMGADAMQFLKTFAPASYIQVFRVDEVDETTFHGILQGANFTRDVVKWLAACAWPPDVSKDYSRSDDWGISWLELLFSFCLFSNKYPPVKTDGQYKAANFWSYTSNQALLQPASARAASRMYYVFHQAILAIKTVTLANLLPEFSCKKCTSLRRFGFRGTFAGLPCRPRLPNPAETIQTVFDYVSSLGGSLTFHRPLSFLTNPAAFDHGPLPEISDGHPLANIPLPRAILPPFARKPEDATPKRRDSTAHRGFFANCCCGFFRGVRNFLRGFFVMLATSYDSDLPVNAPLTQRRPRLKFSGKRRLTRLPKVPLSTVKRARENHGVTLNDIVMAAVTGAIRRYCVHKGDTQLTEGRPVECKSMVMLALPRECDISNPTIALQNKMLFSSVRLPVQEGTRAGRVKQMAEACSDLKSMAYMMGLKFFTNLASMSPRAFLNKATGESWSKHSFLITNVPSTTGPMTWPKGEGGEQLQGITMVIANVMNQVSVISYNGELYSSLVSDPDVIDEEAEFCKMWLSEFEALADPMKLCPKVLANEEKLFPIDQILPEKERHGWSGETMIQASNLSREFGLEQILRSAGLPVELQVKLIELAAATAVLIPELAPRHAEETFESLDVEQLSAPLQELEPRMSRNTRQALRQLLLCPGFWNGVRGLLIEVMGRS